jgi:hypothetical protein
MAWVVELGRNMYVHTYIQREREREETLRDRLDDSILAHDAKNKK